MRNVIIGIDPGKKNGVAIFENHKLIQTKTLNSYLLICLIQEKANIIKSIVIEDSRKQSHIWNANHLNRGAFSRRSRNTGSVDGVVRIIEEACESLKIPLHSVSPAQKARKFSKQELLPYYKYAEHIIKKTNEHERDAIKCVLVSNLCNYTLQSA